MSVIAYRAATGNGFLNAANSDVVYVVTSNSSSRANFQYVCDVYDEDDNLITRLKQRPNTSGIGVFNLGNIVHRNVGMDFGELDNSLVYQTCSSAITDITIYMGEEYSSTITGEVTLYTGEDPVRSGDPAVGDTYQFIDWTYERQETDGGSGLGQFVINQGFLTDMPRTKVPMRSTDDMLVAMANGPANSGSSNYNDIYSIVAATTTIVSNLTPNVENAPRNFLETYSAIDHKFETSHRDGRIAFINAGPSYHTLWDTSDDLVFQVKDETGAVIDQMTITNVEEDRYPIYRLAWRNKYGVLDYFNFNGITQETSTRTDHQYGQSYVDYSLETVLNNPAKRTRRGRKNYLTERTKKINLSTDFLTQEWADWLEGLFMSDDVYVVEEDHTLIPIVLTSADWTRKGHGRGKELRVYNVEFEYSNARRSY